MKQYRDARNVMSNSAATFNIKLEEPTQHFNPDHAIVSEVEKRVKKALETAKTAESGEAAKAKVSVAETEAKAKLKASIEAHVKQIQEELKRL